MHVSMKLQQLTHINAHDHMDEPSVLSKLSLIHDHIDLFNIDHVLCAGHVMCVYYNGKYSML